MDHRWILLFSIWWYVFRSSGSCCMEELPPVLLNCCKCNFSSVPMDLPKNTTRLDFSFNPLKRLHKNHFLEMSKLELLDLTRCSITLIEDHAFFGLENLHTLILTGNPIRHWPPLTFSGLASLHRLVVVETSLTSLSNLPLTQLSLLKELNVAKNLLKSLYLPTYVSSLHILDLRANQIVDIKEKDLENLQNISVSNFSLILSQNQIDHVAPGVFRFISLDMLLLKGCFSNADIMKSNLNAMSGLFAKKLVIGHYRNSFTKIKVLKTGHFEGLCGMNINELTISGLDFFSTPFCECFRNLTSLRVINTDLKFLHFESAASSIQKLEIKRSLLVSMPSTAISALKQLKEIRITKNPQFNVFEDLIELPNLELLDLSRNNLYLDYCCSFISDGLPNLQHLNLSYNPQIYLRSAFLNMSHLRSLDFSHTQLSNVGSHPVFMLMDKLIYLDLSYTQCIFSIQCSFCGLYSVQLLKLSHTTFSNILASVFKNLTELRLLDMSSCGLKYIPTETFASLTLLQTLDLSKNLLLELQALVLTPLISLTILNVSSNNFHSLSEETTQFISQNLVKVDLSHNPYDCSCNQQTFLLWAYEQRSRSLKFSESLKCNTPEYLQGTQLGKVNLSCNLTNYVWFGGFVAAIVIAGGMFHCYKRKYFHLCYSLLKDKKYNSEKEYDAFVIHSSLDEEWVNKELVPKLEDGNPCFKLCLHYRDFIPGIPITTNIVNEGIRRSRKALIIVSQNFIASKWCSFEFEMVMSWQFLESQCGIIVILLEAVNMAHLKHMLGLNKYLRKNTYLKWVDGYVERKVFWRRLREALQQGEDLKKLEDVSGEIYEKQNEHNRMNQ
ncbi:toll-like receptor 4 [Bufo gargarizans]|uniref:toll-like receptor 4 n=1 Tax=Bufo gargarizans TaxID=30331 RepID=UPI001CF35512|nr:toll-like receptor 4 [Bufo gargarizans]